MKRLLLLLIAAASALVAQPVVISAPKVDMSKAGHTLPFIVVANVGALPSASCTPGETAFVLASPAGQQIYTNNGTGACSWTQVSTGGGGATPPGGMSGQIQWNNAGNFAGFTASGDGTLVPSTGALTVTKTNGVAFAPSATTDTTNAANITSGIFGVARGGTGVGTISGIVFGNGASPFTAATVTQVINLWSGCNSSFPLLSYNGSCVANSGGGGSTAPYIVNASTSPQTITAVTHGQGANPIVNCFDGAVSGGHWTGNWVPCPYKQTGGAAGDVQVFWSGTDVGSIWVGSVGTGGGGGGTGVTQVGLSLPAAIFAVSGSPVVTSGTLTGTLLTQLPNTFFRGPTSGGAAAPGFGLLVAADIAAAGTLSNSITGNALTATGAASVPSACPSGSYARGVDSSWNAAGCTVVPTGSVGTTGTITPNAIVTAADPTHIQTPNAATTIDTSGNGTFQGSLLASGRVQSRQSLDLFQGADPGGVANAFSLIPNASITSYRWMVPSADTPGFIQTDGAGTPGHLSIVNVIPTSNGGTGTNSPTGLTTSTPSTVTLTGTFPNQSIAVTSSGGGAVIAHTTNLIAGDGSGNGVDSTIPGANVIVSTGSYTNPGWLAAISAAIITSGTLPVARGGIGVGTLTGLAKGNGTSPFTAATASDVGALGTLTNNTTGQSNTALALATTPSICPPGQAPRGVLANANATGCQAVGGGGSNPLLPAVLGTGTVSASGTSVTGSGTNFSTIFSLCTPTCTNGEHIAIYPIAVSQAGKHIISSPLPQDFGGGSNNQEPSSLIWEPDSNSFSIASGDTITPTRNYAANAGITGSVKEFWSIAGNIGNGSNHLQSAIPVYPNVGSRYPYAYFYCSSTFTCFFYFNSPPNATNGDSVVVTNSPAGAWNGNYVIADNTVGFNYSTESTILQTSNPHSLAAGLYIADGLTTALLSGPTIGNTPTVSIIVSSGTATATFLFPHGLSVGDAIHVSGFTGGPSVINGNYTVATVGNNDFPTVATFTTGAANGTYAQQTGVISLSYTSVPHPVWLPVSSVASNTSLTLGSSAGTVASGANYYSAPDNVAAFTSVISAATDTWITAAGDYYFSNDPTNTGAGIPVNGWSNYFGVSTGVHFILANPTHEGFIFTGGDGFTLDNWTVNALYQAPGVAPVSFIQTLFVQNANRPNIRNFQTQKAVGNLLDIENSTQPRITGLRASNISSGGCIVIAASTQPLVSDGQCLNSVDYTSIFDQNNFHNGNMRGAVMSNWTQVNTGPLALAGPDILVDNFYGEATGIFMFASQNTSGGIKISNAKMPNGGSNRNLSGYADIEIEGALDVSFNNLDMSYPTTNGMRISGNASVTVTNSSFSNVRYEAISTQGGIPALTLKNVTTNTTGGLGLLAFSVGKLTVDGLNITNSNSAYAFPGHASDVIITGSNTQDDVRNVHIFDTRTPALGYSVFIGGEPGRWEGISGLISDPSHAIVSAGGAAGLTYIKNAAYPFPTLNVAGANQHISLSGETTVLNGTSTSIQQINVPSSFQAQDQYCLISSLGSSGITLVTGINIASASTLVNGKINCLKYDGTLFWPSY